MMLVKGTPTVHETLGSTFGKYHGEVDVTEKLKNRDAYVKKHTSLTGMHQFDAIVEGFNSRVSPRSKGQRKLNPRSAGRRGQKACAQQACPSEKAFCNVPVSARERQVKVNAEISRKSVLRPSTAPPTAPCLNVVGTSFPGITVAMGPQLSQVKESERAKTAEGLSNQYRAYPGQRNYTSAHRIYRCHSPPSNASATRVKTAPGPFQRDKLSIVGISREASGGESNGKLETTLQTAKLEKEKPYHATSTEFPLMRRMRPARHCMPARVFYGSLKAGLWTPRRDTDFGRVQVFPNS